MAMCSGLVVATSIFPTTRTKDGNYLFAISQWFPRLVAYTDYEGWTNIESSWARASSHLEFGDYEVALTVPSDHIVAATGELQNANQVSDPGSARSSDRRRRRPHRPVFIVTPEEALENESEGVS